MNRRTFLGILTATVLLVPGPLRAADPASVVEAFHDTLLSVMKEADRLGFKGRYAKIEPAMKAAYDLKRMIRVAAGSHWRAAAPEQQAKLLDAFTRLSVGTYAARFNGYDGERFETLGTKPGPQNTTLVATQIVDSKGKPVGLTYVMLETEGAWRIVDVLLDSSISELAVRRSEYSRVLRQGGIDRLTATLNEKADALAAEKG